MPAKLEWAGGRNWAGVGRPVGTLAQGAVGMRPSSKAPSEGHAAPIILKSELSAKRFEKQLYRVTQK